MARIIYSGLVTGIRGSIGGTTFQNNAYGCSVKNKPVMVNPNSVLQSRSKVILTQAVKAWGIPSAVLQPNWNNFAVSFPQYAKHNPSAQLSGFAAFVKFHTAQFLGLGLTAGVVSVPNTIAPVTDSLSFYMQNVSPSFKMNLVFVNSTGNWKVNIFMSRPLTASQVFIGSAPLFITCVDSISDAPDIDAEYVALYGRIPEVNEYVNILAQFFDPVGGRVLADVSYREKVHA